MFLKSIAVTLLVSFSVYAQEAVDTNYPIEDLLIPQEPLPENTVLKPIPDPDFPENAPRPTNDPQSVPPEPAPEVPPQPMPTQPTIEIPTEQTIMGPEPISAPVAAQSFLVPQVDEFADVYLPMILMTNAQGFGIYANGIGHTVAAAQLVACAPQMAPIQRVEALHQMVDHLEAYPAGVIHQTLRNGGRTWNPLLTQIAAHLVCKSGSRSPQEMVQTLFNGYQELKARYAAKVPGQTLSNQLHNLLVAAMLIQ
jgi:hypothetical protein